MTCIVLYTTGMYVSVLRYKFLILDTYQPDIYIYVIKGLKIHRYFRSHKGSTSNKSG